ncbi:hypothetical protein [Rubritalea tangerina]|uniref:hypothetical protein n=1 Tax=Rubritalea tangerina TaxID=430798 RepID=UPI00361F0909
MKNHFLTFQPRPRSHTFRPANRRSRSGAAALDSNYKIRSYIKPQTPSNILTTIK